LKGDAVVGLREIYIALARFIWHRHRLCACFLGQAWR